MLFVLFVSLLLLFAVSVDIDAVVAIVASIVGVVSV